MNTSATPRIAVAFLARGAGTEWPAAFRRFLDSYLRQPAGVAHELFVLFKGFRDGDELARGRAIFDEVPHRAMMLEDHSFDIGAYAEWAHAIDADIVCALNTASEILSDRWLAKLASNLTQPGVGLVGATASFESLNDWNPDFPVFPNPHVRSNAFMMTRGDFCRITDGLVIRDKLDAFNFESGHRSMSRQVRAMGKEILVVGRNGRGYAPPSWPGSDTFRLGFQRNLLVGDNQTRNYMELPWNEKREFVVRTWGPYLRDFERMTP